MHTRSKLFGTGEKLFSLNSKNNTGITEAKYKHNLLNIDLLCAFYFTT